jgi:hypothetical protein
MTTGPRPDLKANLYDKLQRANNAKVIDIVKKYLADTGKQAEQLTQQDFKAIVDETRAAGAALQECNQHLETTNPTVGNLEGALENATETVGPELEAIVEDIP